MCITPHKIEEDHQRLQLVNLSLLLFIVFFFKLGFHSESLSVYEVLNDSTSYILYHCTVCDTMCILIIEQLAEQLAESEELLGDIMKITRTKVPEVRNFLPVLYHHLAVF